MFTAKVFTVYIPSSGVALEEEHIAREVLTQWNIENGGEEWRNLSGNPAQLQGNYS